MSDTPVIQLDFEFTFASGLKEYATAQEGRDIIEETAQRIHLVIHHEDGAIEDIEVTRSALACVKTARREVKPEPKADGGYDYERPMVDALPVRA